MVRPLPDPVLFLDECLGTTDVAGALREAGAEVEVLVDHFSSGTHDEVWLSWVGQRGWVVLSKDKWIRKRSVELTALRATGVAAFVLAGGDMKGSEMAHAFVTARTPMRKLLRDYEPPFIAKVTAHGKVELLDQPVRRAAIRRDR